MKYKIIKLTDGNERISYTVLIRRRFLLVPFWWKLPNYDRGSSVALRPLTATFYTFIEAQQAVNKYQSSILKKNVISTIVERGGYGLPHFENMPPPPPLKPKCFTEKEITDKLEELSFGGQFIETIKEVLAKI